MKCSTKVFNGLLAAALIGLTALLTGCGSGGASGGTSTSGGTTTPTATITGTAATGAAMAGATITVKDAKGALVGTTTATTGGTFTLSVATPANYTPPFMLQAVPASGSPASPQYSLLLNALVAATTTNVDITPVTSLILYEATKTNLATVFTTPASYSSLSSSILTQAQNNVVTNLPALSTVAASTNFFTQTFTANGTDAYDKALDTLGVTGITFSGNAPTLTNAAGATVTYNPTTPLYPIKAVVVAAGSAQQVADGASYNLITATVTNTQSAPSAGVTVDYSTSAGTLYASTTATASSSSAITDASGVARMYLKASTVVGSATVSAQSADKAASGTASVKFIAGAPAAIGLSASPSSVIPGASTILTAVVTDANGNLVADGESVTLSTSPNTGNFGGSPIVTLTTKNGYITQSYTAGNTSGTETITATATNSVNKLLVLTISSAAPAITRVTLSSASSSLIADGHSSTTLTATVQDSGGKGVPGALVAFATSAGVVTPTSATTNASGVATATLTSGTQVLTAAVTASANGITATSNVGYTAGAGAAVGINAMPSTVKPAGTSTVTVSVVDANGNAVSNEPVTLSFTAKGSGTPSLSAVSGSTDANGLLAVTYTAGSSNGTDTILATSSKGKTSSSNITVSNTTVIGSITTSANSGSIPVGGSTVIRALVKDNNGLAAPGVTVAFATTAGTLSSPSAITDVNGIASVTLSAGTQILTASVSATISGFSSTTPVNFTAGAPSNVVLSAAPNSVKPGGTSSISAYVTDASGNPVVGQTVTFSIPTRGSGQPMLSAVTAATSSNGLATVTYTAGTGTGTDTVTAITSNGVTPATPVSISVSPTTVVVGSVVVTSNSATIPVNGNTQVQAMVKDTGGQSVPGVTVTFSSSTAIVGGNAGTLSPASAVTDATGVARATLTAGNAILTATISASTGGISGSTQVGFTTGAAAVVSVSASPNAVKHGGASTLTIAVVDGNGNPVANEPITLSFTSHGSGVPTLNLTSGTTNSSGLLFATYAAGATSGLTDIVKAVASTGANGSTTITVNDSNAVVGTVTLVAANTSILVSTSTVLTATVLDTGGQPISGASVSFGTNGGTLSSAIGTTNASGVATTTLTAGTATQAATVRASASNVSGSAVVNITSGTAAVVGLNAMPNTVKPGGTSLLTVAVTDANGNVVANEPVNLTFTASGSGTPSLSAVLGTTNANGLLVVNYTAGANAGSDTLSARTSTGVIKPTTIIVSASATVIGSVTTSANSGSIPVGGSTVIRALVKDNNGLVVQNATVAFSTTAGTLSGAPVTDVNGIASVTLSAGPQILTATVSASISGFTSTVPVAFTSGAANAVGVSAAPSAVKPGGTSSLSAYVVDANNNPVAGETVTFSISIKGSGQATLAVVSAATSNNGLATVTYTAGTGSGTDTVTALTSNGKSGSTNITVNPSATVVSSIALVSGATSLPADGTSAATLRANVMSGASPAVGVTVTFAASGGGLSEITAVTDSSGNAQVTLTSPTHTGTVTVTATASGFVASQSVAIVAGSPTVGNFVLSANPATVNAGGTSTLTAIVLDANSNPVVGQTVTFSIKTNTSGGSMTTATAVTNASGIASGTYTGGNTLGTDTVQAALVGGLTTPTSVLVAGGTVNALSIATSSTSVKSDNSLPGAIITVTALSSTKAVLSGITVNFSADGGQLSAQSVTTLANGQAVVTFYSGAQNKSNATYTITASAAGASDVLIPIQVVGSTVSLTTTASSLTAGGTPASLTVTAKDAGGTGIYNVPVTLSQTGAGGLTLSTCAYAGQVTANTTDVNGQCTVVVNGVAAGSTTVTAAALGATATQGFAVLPATTFGISAIAYTINNVPVVGANTDVTTGKSSLHISAGANFLTFNVTAPTQASVRLSTTVGTWLTCPGGTAGGSVCTTSVAAKTASAALTSAISGKASVQVDGLDASGNVTGTVNHTVYVTGTTATSVYLQASASNIQPSSGGTSHTLSLIATARDANGQPVGGVPISFTMINTTGGGETISPVIQTTSDGTNSTNPLGQAVVTFTSGSLPSGQSNSSVQIMATAWSGGNPVSNTQNIVIGGTAGSVVIGAGTTITADAATHTVYAYPMSVLVADSNGNPVPTGTVVSLSVWPVDDAKGYWVPTGSVPNTVCVSSAAPGSVTALTWLPNEDLNEDLILEAGEDTNGNGRLDPPNSAAGTLPSSVVTDANGVASFNLSYLIQNAAWVKVRVRASALVQGSETSSQLVFVLPAMATDAATCVLPNSPFN